MSAPVLEVANLHVRIGGKPIVRGVSLTVERERTLGIVGESGSGKSMTVLAATGLLDAPGAMVDGSSIVAGQGDSVQLVGASPRALRTVNGGRIGFVFRRRGPWNCSRRWVCRTRGRGWARTRTNCPVGRSSG